MKSLSLAPLAAGAVILCGALLSFEASSTEPGTIPPGNPRTLDLTAVPMTITESGTYVLRRNWDLGSRALPPDASSTTAITVTASNVVIDFQGYQIKYLHNGQGIKIKGNDVRLRNGSLYGDWSGDSSAVRSSGTGTVLENMSIYSYEGSALLGPYAEVRDSDLFARGSGLQVGDYAVVERNLIRAHYGAVVLSSHDRVEHNRLQAFADAVVDVRGDRDALIDNTIESELGGPGGGPGFGYAVSVVGNSNTLLRNTVLLPMSFGSVFSVNGTANTLDANVAPPTGEGMASYGISFAQPGNFYGNNRMSAQTPFYTGGLPQTDWGGNVGY